MTDGGYGGISAEQLQNYIDRVERLEAEKKSLQDDVKEVYNEAKANGFDPKIMRRIVQRRRMDREDRQQHDSMVELYEGALEASAGPLEKRMRAGDASGSRDSEGASDAGSTDTSADGEAPAVSHGDGSGDALLTDVLEVARREGAPDAKTLCSRFCIGIGRASRLAKQAREQLNGASTASETA